MRTKTLDIDLGGEVLPLELDNLYQQYRILVRSGMRPVGWIHVSENMGSQLSVAALREHVLRSADTLVKQAVYLHTAPRQEGGACVPISVVVCTRNRTDRLAACLQHLRLLDYPNFEIIVVDNAPDSDDTRTLVADMNVRYVREDTPGLDWARNRAIAEARHDLLAFTDDDVQVDRLWLQAINAVFTDPDVMGASGMVAAAELETPAQHLFEYGYGGMGHGFSTRYLQRGQLGERQLLWASSFGVGANMAFRKAAFHKAGPFDTALDVGTPSHGGGDVEMFHRLVCSGLLFVYEPSMLVWHYHRRDWPSLKKQIFDNGRSFGCFLINCFLKRTVSRAGVLRFAIIEWLYKWNIKNLLRRRKQVPASLTIAELRGLLTSPFAYIQTQRQDRRLRLRRVGRAGP